MEQAWHDSQLDGGESVDSSALILADGSGLSGSVVQPVDEVQARTDNDIHPQSNPAAMPSIGTKPADLPREQGLRRHEAALLELPAEPMAPIYDERLPKGDEWCYQLKWDGVRILTRIHEDGEVELYSRSMFLKNAIYPEIVRVLQQRAKSLGPCLLDGEVVWWNGIRPNFQQVLKRERSRGSSIASIKGDGDSGSGSTTGSGGGLVYVLFDLLADRGTDLRQQPYSERYRMLSEKFGEKDPQLFVTDMFQDGDALWEWVESNQWEGVVSKRLSSSYIEGKKHRDWYKKKTAVLLDVDIVGLKWRSGMIASLVMAYEGSYLGSVSSGLSEPLRKVLMSTFRPGGNPVPALPCPFPGMPDDLKREEVQWLHLPFRCRVTGLEVTSAGQLRHPKLVTFLPKDSLS
ncbi:bifunctional non-homologous end joining protein LigD [Paenibacillus phyllosphaerae]|uniref:Bifunctional non-homologous end joining protein LigD n=1 Tax=Paenibacillus phyllosphaerae TaxID=274593 RepID=A0A7W5B0B4_9BACL|nr:DNA ligase [Paenibacillus phyllosphaerae]MBB3112069.1 bifunctional non-homologous end joining protein LigD [Paenibacillus phyllosphaerae]